MQVLVDSLDRVLCSSALPDPMIAPPITTEKPVFRKGMGAPTIDWNPWTQEPYLHHTTSRRI